jgi:ABC-type branched-subunit amino acid transport system ATPase component
MTSHAPTVFTAEKLSFSFPGKQVLDAVDFSLHAGTITCLLGGNGAGKTTLFNLISGFLRPESGKLQFGTTELIGRQPFRISRLGVARTFQDLRLIGKLSVRDNILLALPRHPGERLGRALLPPGFHRERDAADLRKTDTLLEEFFLAQVADQAASEISYGQQKLLTLTCCAAMDASLLLLDEPVAGISHEFRGRIAERLDSFKAAGKTILLIEHQPDFLEYTGDTFLFLQAGKLHGFDTLNGLRAAPIAHDALA